jgi:hypothetical protein
MENITDEEIFDILDGLAENDVIKKHVFCLEHSQEYVRKFNYIANIHGILSEQPILELSPKFTSNLIGKLSINKKEKSFVTFPLYAMLGILIMMLIFSYLIVIIANKTNYVPTFNYNISQFTKQMLLIMNGLLILWIFDKTILKKIMINTFN